MVSPETPLPIPGIPTTTTTTTDPTSVKTTTKPKKKISKEEAAAYIQDPRFNRIFNLPADPSRGRSKPFQISYSDFGYHRDSRSSIDGENESEEEEQQVLLFFGPLCSSRLFATTKDELAKRYKIRILNPERPGIGKTDDASAEKRMDIWREAMPALLNHLNIKHVAVASHSAGTIYALDFAFHNPQHLYPSRPYIALGGPWIHPSKSGMRVWSLASSLPTSLVGQTDKLATFVMTTLGPVIGVSAAVTSGVSQLWSKPKEHSGREGPDVEFEEAVRERLAQQVFSENVRGLSQESQVVLRNGVEKDGWSDWTEYDLLAPRLAEAVRDAGVDKKLKVNVFFAEKDQMIGDEGSKAVKWFEDCWKDVDGIEFTSTVVKGSDHDCVWDLRWDVVESVFKSMIQKN